MIVRASVVLPQPDSPTSASTSPARTSRSTPSTARATAPLRAGKWTCEVAHLERASVAHVARRRARGRGCRRRAGRRPPARARRRVDGHSPTRDGAARMERAPDGSVARIGRIAAEPGRRHAEARGRRSSGTPPRAPPCTGARAVRTRPSRRALLDDAPGVHDRRSLADVRQRREVVGDEDHREPELALQLARGARAPGPAPSRRARSSARRRSGARGLHASASAMSTRCRWPPESWCG